MRLMFALLLCIVFTQTHVCNPKLKQLKHQISKKINNALYELDSLETQARINLKNLKTDYGFCYVENKLHKLREIIRKYQEFYVGAKPGDDLSQIDLDFVQLKDEISRINKKCNDAIRKTCENK
ncbi:uncharacterized protein LOC123004929 [Tribolium madens]|uniref:uncharacterized protein LOC123004929 n=1 Tax=Tribolium madens TaxID=41895 RepID=UPI001CF7452A|nr:uncharacterized protein LOC123004929 [Tribolium madens]